MGVGIIPVGRTDAEVDAELDALPSRYATVNFAATSYELLNPGNGPHTTLIQDALDEAAATSDNEREGRSIVQLGNHKYTVGNLVMPQGVHLKGDGSRLEAAADGWVIDMPNVLSSVSDIYIHGQAATYESSGIRSSSSAAQLSRISIHSTQGPAYKFTSGSIIGRMTDCFNHSAWSYASGLAAPVGALEIEGTDHYITNSEVGTSRASLSTGGYVYGVVVKGAAHWLTNVLSEVNDHGWYINGSILQLAKCRSDLNRGHGYVVDGGSGVMSGCIALSNGRETTNTYDGFIFQNQSRMMVDACIAQGTGNTHRYGFNDTQAEASSHNSFSSTCLSINHGTAPIARMVSAGGNAGGAAIAATTGGWWNVSAGATTFDAQAPGWPHSNFSLNSASPVTMTNFTNGVVGQDLFIIGDGQTTFSHGGAFGNIRTISGSNTLAASGKLHHFKRFNNTWVMMAISG